MSGISLLLNICHCKEGGSFRLERGGGSVFMQRGKEAMERERSELQSNKDEWWISFDGGRAVLSREWVLKEAGSKAVLTLSSGSRSLCLGPAPCLRVLFGFPQAPPLPIGPRLHWVKRTRHTGFCWCLLDHEPFPYGPERLWVEPGLTWVFCSGLSLRWPPSLVCTYLGLRGGCGILFLGGVDEHAGWLSKSIFTRLLEVQGGAGSEEQNQAD